MDRLGNTTYGNWFSRGLPSDLSSRTPDETTAVTKSSGGSRLKPRLKKPQRLPTINDHRPG